MDFSPANTYADQLSEIYLGKALKDKRRDAIIATKFFNPIGPGPNDSGMSRVHIMQAIDDSLRRLDMDYVDIYYIHHVDAQTPLQEMLRAVDDLVHHVHTLLDRLARHDVETGAAGHEADGDTVRDHLALDFGELVLVELRTGRLLAYFGVLPE